MKEKMDSRLEGGPFDGAEGRVKAPPPEMIFLRPCGRCECEVKNGFHWRLDARPGYECYRLLRVAIGNAPVAVYGHDGVDLRPSADALARQLALIRKTEPVG